METLTELSMGWVVRVEQGKVGEGFWASISSWTSLVLQQGKLSAIVFHCNIITVPSLNYFSWDEPTLEKRLFFIVVIISCRNISSWFSPILGTISLPTTTLVMKDRDAIIASSLSINIIMQTLLHAHNFLLPKQPSRR